MKKLNRLTPLALKSAKSLVENGRIPREYNGYIASFGASIILSGLLPAVAFYENINAEANQDKTKMTKAILSIIKEDKRISEEYGTLMNFVLSSGVANIKQEILDAATALKLAIRTFKFTEKEKS